MSVSLLGGAPQVSQMATQAQDKVKFNRNLLIGIIAVAAIALVAISVLTMGMGTIPAALGLKLLIGAAGGGALVAAAQQIYYRCAVLPHVKVLQDPEILDELNAKAGVLDGGKDKALEKAFTAMKKLNFFTRSDLTEILTSSITDYSARVDFIEMLVERGEYQGVMNLNIETFESPINRPSLEGDHQIAQEKMSLLMLLVGGVQALSGQDADGALEIVKIGQQDQALIRFLELAGKGKMAQFANDRLQEISDNESRLSSGAPSTIDAPTLLDTYSYEDSILEQIYDPSHRGAAKRFDFESFGQNGVYNPSLMDGGF